MGTMEMSLFNNFRGEIILINPPNEIVLCKIEQKWNMIGPITCDVADALVKIFRCWKAECFICLESEFKEKGLPIDERASNYIYFKD